MPASMMIAVAGSILKVSESRNATAPTGPKPGKTPTKVPTREPIKQKSKLVGVSATEKPTTTLVKTSTSDSQKTGGQRNAEEQTKDRVGNDRGGQRYGDHLRPLLSLDRAEQEGHQQKSRQKESHRLERQGKKRHRRQSRADSRPASRFQGFRAANRVGCSPGLQQQNSGK